LIEWVDSKRIREDTLYHIYKYQLEFEIHLYIQDRLIMKQIIEPGSYRNSHAIHELWVYRDLIWMMAWRNITSRYRQMALGPLWIILIPIVNMVIFSVIFGKIANLPSEGIPYPIFTFSALLPWTFFSNSVTSSVGGLVNNINLISKVYFPRIILIIAATLPGLVDLAFSFLVLMVMMLYYGIMPSPRILALPFFILIAMITALSVGMWGAALAVRFRDVQHIVTYGLQIWMYATPVAYSASLIPERWQVVYQLNPMYWVVEGFRWALLSSSQSLNYILEVSLSIMAISFISGYFVFKKMEGNIVDIL
jgi:lipopolysaccharide transport system permease protein